MPFLRIPQKSKSRLAYEQKDRERISLAVAGAHHFTTTIFRNGGYQTIRSTSLAEARTHRTELEQAANNHRRAMIYAVTPDGHTHFVPDNFQH